jgi:cytochrome P450
MTVSLNETRNKIDGSALYKQLRAEQPVYFDPQYQMFVVSRYEDVLGVLREATLFSSAKAIMSSYQFEEVVVGVLDEKGHGRLKEVLPMTDPPEHTRVRSMVNLAFSSIRVAKVRKAIEALTQEMVERVLDKGRIEVVEELARPLPVTVIGDLLSLPRERWRDIIRWTVAYSTCAGNMIADREHALRVGHDLAELQNFIVDQLNQRRSAPGDDTLTDLLSARYGDYAPLDEKEILAVAVAFVGAGHETTTVAITNLFKVLAEHPEVVETLRSAPAQDAAIRNFVEEFLRLNPPLNAQPRVATADTEIAGVKIPSGSRLLLVNASANRDERQFGGDAESLCPMRANANRHLTFGGGVHACLGNMLARAELQCVTQAIVNRMDRLQLVQPDIPLSDYGPVIMPWNYCLQRLGVSFSKRA